MFWEKLINAMPSNHRLRLPVFRLHRVFMFAGKALVLGFLCSVLSACVPVKAHLETINEPAQNLYLIIPVISLEIPL
jgi:hypothetical protein